MRTSTRAEVLARVGNEVGLSPWVEMSQDTINRFADLTDDHNFIPIDPVAAAAFAAGSCSRT